MITIGSIWGSEIYVTPSIIEATPILPLGKVFHEFKPVQYDYVKHEFTNIYIICENCRKILDTLIHEEDNKSKCVLCRSEKLWYLPQQLIHKYENRINEKISDAEFLQILIELTL
jgi:hypothetical protein